MRVYVAAALISLAATPALPCACCVEPGERLEYEDPVDAYAIDELRRLVADGTARLYTTACDMDCVEGIADPRYDYPVVIAVRGSGITLDFGAAGSLRLPMPETFQRFSVDVDPLAEDPSRQLYTEFRLSAPLQATGDFAAADGAEGRLVLAGASNACWSADSLLHWSLDVTGQGVAFRLFGGLAPPT